MVALKFNNHKKVDRQILALTFFLDQCLIPNNWYTLFCLELNNMEDVTSDLTLGRVICGNPSRALLSRNKQTDVLAKPTTDLKLFPQACNLYNILLFVYLNFCELDRLFVP